MKRILSLIIILLTLFSLITGCSSSNNGYESITVEYESITVENELCSYSFSYSSTYEKEFLDNLEFKVPYTNLLLLGPMGTEEAEVFDPDVGEIQTVSGKRATSSININVSNRKTYYGESFSAVDEIEHDLEAESRWANFQLIDRSPLTVSGVQGEKIEYLVDRLMPIPVEDGKNLDYHCIVYFDYNGLLWFIEARCIQELREQVKADFDYIVQSFKIIR